MSAVAQAHAFDAHDAEPITDRKQIFQNCRAAF